MERLTRFWWAVSDYLAPEALPSLVPVLLLILVGSAVAAIVLGDRLGIGVPKAFTWFVCLLIPMAYTLTATTYQGKFGCEVGLLPWDSRAALVAGETISNVLLTVPAGAAALLFPVGLKRLAALGAALTIPFLVEFAQMVSPPLGRGCQVSDVIANMVGVALGFCLGAGVAVLWVSLCEATRTGRILSEPRSARDHHPV